VTTIDQTEANPYVLGPPPGYQSSNIIDLQRIAERRRQRQESDAERHVVPIQTEREAYAFAAGEGNGGRARAMLRHPDLAALIARAHKLVDPRQWNGFIPPREWQGKYNDSPIRRVIVECCAEAWRREGAR
jgi:hypothetical protein